MAALLVLLLTGCRQQSPPVDFESFIGTVEGVRPDTGLLVVRVNRPTTLRQSDERITCLVPGDAEIYVNDRFSRFEAIEIGDTVELVGYIERVSRAQRFVVSSASISRNVPPPPPLELAPPATQATTQPREK